MLWLRQMNMHAITPGAASRKVTRNGNQAV